jgi:glycerophosphoryl diester phosphodiesterase
MNHQLTPWPYPLWIAHRGAGKLAPENTLAAFRLGAQHGYRMFECDAKLSRDGVVFLLHDAHLDRTTNGRGVGGDHTWRQLMQLDAGTWHSSAFTGEPLPTLTDIAQFCLANDYCLNIEIKPSPDKDVVTGHAVALAASTLWENEKILPLLTSFKPDALSAAHQAAYHLPRGLLLDTLWDNWFETAIGLQCQAIVFNHKLLDQKIITHVHNAGIRCLAYTVNSKKSAEQLLNWQIDGLITDRVDLFSP